MKKIVSRLKTMTLAGKTVFLRADLNVPLQNGTIQNTFKLESIQPTLDFLLSHKAKVVLATHLGRPKKAESDYSTKQLLPWFTNHNYQVDYTATPKEAAKKIHSLKSGFILLENLRFFPGEKDYDATFAQELKECGSIYVNDAFGVLHRTDTSITLLPELYTQEHKSIGFLIEKEINHLNKLVDNPQKPLVLVLGGGKVATKLACIKALLEKVDHILLCPALVFTLLKALNKPVGISTVDDSLITSMQELWDLPQAQKVISLPMDYQVALDESMNKLCITAADKFPNDAFGLAIGPKTINDFEPILNQAKTIFFNAAMGFNDKPESQTATQELLKLLASNQNAYTVVGGGDSVAAAFATGVNKKISFLSTGGGATLTYLSGKPLPGLNALFN